MSDLSPMNKLLAGESRVWLPLLSGSMAPMLLPGDELYIEPAPRRFRRGDIAVFYARGQFFSHRILLIIPLGKKRLVLEKGDANRDGSFISGNKAIGIVTRVKRADNMLDLTLKKELNRSRKIAAGSLLAFLKFRILIWKH